jgi:type II secretion system protein D
LLVVPALRAEPDPAPPGKENASRPKTVAFEMRDKPWSSVLEWLSDQTGLPVITSYKPTGTFSFIDPKKKEYTIPEIIDILNEGLLEKKFVLIRRERSFTIVPADEKIPPDYLPRIRLEDLEGHGNTEIAQIVLPLTSLVAEDLQPEVKKMMGPFGEAVAMAKANQLILTDTVGNLKRVCKTIKDIEETENQGKETFSHVCRYIKARDAEKNLHDLLGDPKELLRGTQPMFPFGGFGGGRGGGGGGGGGFMQPQPQPVAAAPAQKVRMHYISCDERTNTVLVTGPADKIAQAREILRNIDVPQQGQQPVIVGPAFLKTYPIAAGNAEALAKILQDTYKSSQVIRISAAGNNTILVWAPPEDQIEIAKHITGATENNQVTEVLPLNAQDATKTVETLKGMFGDTKAGAPYLEADTNRNAVVVRGSTEQLAQIKAALQAIGETGVSSGTMRVITINKGSAAAVAEALQRMLPQMRQNPVNVIIQGNEVKPAAPANKSAGKSDSPGGGEEQEPPAKGQLDDSQKKAPAAEKPGKKESAITITAIGNKLVVTSDDPQALALVQDLVRVLTTTPGAEGDFEVIKLKNASATEAAKVLDEAFNGTKQQPAQQGFPFFNPFRGMGAQPPAAPAENRIRVVADPTSNSLLVKASPVDMLTIRRLLEKAIDSGTTESNAIDRTWVVGPLKYASASDVASVVRDIYREHMNNNPIPGQTPGFRVRGPMQNLNLDANGNPRAVTLSVGVDDRSNSLIVNCSTAMHEDIKKLAQTLDTAAKDSTKTIQVVPIRGVDPTLVQQAIYAIQGRTPPGQQGTNQNQNRGGFPGMGGGMGGNRGGFGGGNNNGQRGNNGRGGGGPTASLSPGSGTERGPDFFADRVTDDPQQTALLYDPHHDSAVASSVSSDQGLAEEQEEQAPPQRAPAGQGQQGNIAGPRSEINVDAVPELGAVIISGNTPADVAEIIRVIRELERLSEPAQVILQVIPLKQADATSVSNTLNQVFQRVTIGPYSSATNPRATTSTTVQNPFFQASSTTQPAASIVLIPLPRQNAILVAAPKVRMKDVIQEIDRLDVPDSKLSTAHYIPLKHASAARVATLLINFYAQRYPTETGGTMQVRITHDDSSNSLIVQAAPADLAQIRDLAMQLDSMESQAVNDLLIVPLHYIGSDELTAILQQAIYQGIVAPTAPVVGPSGTATTPTGGVGGGAFGGAGGGFGGGFVGGARPPGTTGTTGFGTGITGAPGATTGIGAPGAATPTVSPAAAAAGVATKTTKIRLIGPKGPGTLSTVAESGLLEDIHVTSVARINSVIISAPTKSMDLILKLIAQLDVLPQLRADIKIFPLKNADANATAILVQQLFLGTTGTTGTTTPTAPTGAPFGGFGGGGVPGGGGFGGGGGGAGAAGTGAFRAPATTAAAPGAGFAQGATTETAPLILLRIAVDQRTNSVIVGGSRADLDMVEVIIDRLDNARIQNRPSRIYQMRNAAAADVASAINTFLNNRLSVLSSAQQLTAFQEIQQAVVVVPEPVSNKLLISATPAYFDEIIRLIEQLDAEPPQVVIQCLIAEVDLTNTEEFGIQLGLQSPILFERSVVPQTFALGPNGSVTYTNAAGGQVAPGVTVNSSINPTAQPGFQFNNVANPLGNNPLASPNTVGYQGLTNLGVGFSSPLTSGVGGFVFSASSDAVNVLVRALATQGRVDVLSRPQLTTMDNQASSVLVGQSVPYVTGTNITATGLVTNSINYRNVGVSLQVVPRISPDGKVIMRIVPEVSSVATTPIGLGNNVTATAFNDQLVQTTVIAQDGETVVLGGVISKNDSKIENKIPWLGDLPIVGALWRYRQESKSKNELIIIMTPHIVRTRLDADRILAEESHRMEWIIGDVLKIQGPSGMEPILPSPTLPGAPGSAFPGVGSGCDSAAGPFGVPAVPGLDSSLPAPSMLPAQTGPPPTPVSPPASGATDPNIPMPFPGTPNPTVPLSQQASGFYPTPSRRN